MKYKGIFRTHHLYILFSVFLMVLGNMSTSLATTATTLLDDVVSLKLGMNGYIIGQKLNDSQKEHAGKHPVEGAYQDTYKFVDNHLFVVVDKKSDRVLALYRQEKKATKNQLKEMVVELINLFDTPTTMAHDKILYWAFNKYGAISEDDFNTAKKIKQTPNLGIIATVKLNSEMEIAPDSQEGEQETSEKKKEDQTGSIYFIITSDPMIQEFITSRQ